MRTTGIILSVEEAEKQDRDFGVNYLKSNMRSEER